MDAFTWTRVRRPFAVGVLREKKKGDALGPIGAEAAAAEPVLELMRAARAQFFFWSCISEHADGDRRGKRSRDEGSLETHPTETFPGATLRFDPAPRHSPSACAEKVLKIDPHAAHQHDELPPLVLRRMARAW